MITVDLSDRPAAAHAVSIYVPALRAFLRRAQKAVPLAGDVSVLLASDAAVRKLNRDFRGLDHATDVLSFPAARDPKNKSRTNAAHWIAGDLAISIDTASRQAKRFRHSLMVELKVLLLHGLLHLAGNDHETDNGEMSAKEEQLRRRFRLPSALIARTLRTDVGAPNRAGHR